MRKLCILGGILMLVAAGVVVSNLIGTYNHIQEKDESVKAAWAQVLNVYKRRADLVPNLVNAVKGYAAHEQQTLTEVANARAKATSLHVHMADAKALQNFQAAQGELQSALARLMVVAERYPELKASKQFEDLQVQLEGTENRIALERQRYIEAVKEFNTFVRAFPNNLLARLFGHPEKPSFTVENERQLSDAPVVDFGK